MEVLRPGVRSKSDVGHVMTRAMPRLVAFLLTLAIVAPALVGSARAELRIDITQANIQPMPIAITPFFGKNEAATTAGRELAQVISADLERSGLFKPVDPRAFIQTPDQLQTQPRFPDWRAIAAQALVTGAAEVQTDG